MFRNYLKVAFRNLIRYKVFSFVNILGLALGLTCFFLAILWGLYHSGFDRQNEFYDQIYRVNRIFLDPDGSVNLYLNQNAPQVGPLLKNDFPEILSSTRILYRRQLMSKGESHYIENGFVYADNSISEIFTFQWLKGNPKTALMNPNSLVITEDIAGKYFGTKDPLGETIECETNGVQNSLTITGLIKNLPSTSHLQFNFIGSMGTWENLAGTQKMQDWSNNDYLTYILLPMDCNPMLLESQFSEFMKNHLDNNADKWTKLELEKLSDIHLKNFREPVYYLKLIALLILIVACLNFVNLSTARSAIRTKEIGIRKVVGAMKSQIIQQLLIESIMTTLLAYGITLFLLVLILPYFNSLFSDDISISLIMNVKMIIILTVMTIFIGIVAGIAPSIFFASFRPAVILKGAVSWHGGKASLRKFLVVAQFTITSIFIICMGIISNQLEFMQNKELGFSKEGVLILPSSTFIQNNMELVKQQLLHNPNILGVSGASRVPPDRLNDANDGSVSVYGRFENIKFRLPYVKVDYDYLPTFKIQILEGRNFLSHLPTDIAESFILNETAVKKMGFASARAAINAPFRYGGRNGKIIGVVKDFHFEAVNREISPLILLLSATVDIIAVRIRTDDISGTLAFLKTNWEEFNPGHPFQCAFEDYRFDRQYSEEMKIREIFGYSSMLAIFIACLGLFGLASYTIQQRIKEIGIRKVLGASVPAIIYILSKDSVKWVVYANLIAWPIAWYAMNKWLQDFAYRIEISLWVFIFSGGISLLIAMLTISYQAIKAAMANPVEALRYE